MARLAQRSNSIITSGWNAQGTEFWYQVKGFAKRTFDRSKASAECNHRAMLAGWEDRLIDAAAVARSKIVKENGIETTVTIPDEQRYALMDTRMQTLAKHYETGTKLWTVRAESVPDYRDQWTREAIIKVLKWTPEQLEDKLGKLAEKRKETVAKTLEYFRAPDSPVRAEYIKIRDAAEKSAQPSGEARALLEELENL